MGMRAGVRGLLLGFPPGAAQSGGAPADDPENTVAPAINAAAVIGTEIAGDDGTWSAVPDSYAYQWQRFTGGAWADIALATNKNYTPVDANFGLALQLVVTATFGETPVAAASNSTALVAEAPAQSYGTELVTNGTMEAGDPPTGWTAAVGTIDGVADERPGGAGVQLLSIISNGANGRAEQPVSLSVGMIEVSAWLKSGTANISLDLTGVSGSYMQFATGGAWVSARRLVRTGSTSATLRLSNLQSADGSTSYADDVSIRAVTPNTPLVAPSANMRLDVYYDLPATPISGSQIWLLPRVSDFSAGNYWVAELYFNGATWSATLYSVATHTRTSRIAAADVGVTDGLRVNMNADSISLYTTANGGTNWTQRGSTITNDAYQAATGVNALHTSDVTGLALRYAPAD